MSEPLSLFWWKGAPNFGDDLSRAVVGHVSGRDVAWADKQQADMVAIGSILQGVRNQIRNGAPRAHALRVWGTGLMHPVAADFLGELRVHLLRGPITASLLGIEARSFGDPGLLAAETFGPVAQQDYIALVPHISQIDDPMVAEIVAADPALRLVDPRRTADEVCAEIAAAAHVISSSLHGLVVADSYGVANTWLDPAGIHAMSALKFYDYAAGIQRPLASPVHLGDVPALLPRLKDTNITYADGIAAGKEALMAHFPVSLRPRSPLPVERANYA